MDSEKIAGPKVSVAMISYNHERFVAQAIESVLMQDVDFPMEIVIGDDCSTDGTAAIIEQYRSRHPELIRVLKADRNLGMFGNFERVFFACRGQYIAMLEGDDYWTDRRKLGVQVAFMDENLECTACGHSVVFRDERSGQVEEKTPETNTPLFSTFKDLLHSNILPTCSVMWRRGIVPAFPKWMRQLAMCDWPCHLFHAQHGKVAYLPQVMATYRMHTGGMWRTRGLEANCRDMLKALEVMRGRFSAQHARDFDRNSLQWLAQLARFYRSAGLSRRCLYYTFRYISTALYIGRVDSLLVRLLVRIFIFPPNRLVYPQSSKRPTRPVALSN